MRNHGEKFDGSNRDHPASDECPWQELIQTPTRSGANRPPLLTHVHRFVAVEAVEFDLDDRQSAASRRALTTSGDRCAGHVHRGAAVDHDRRSIHVGGFVRGEEDNDVGHILRPTESRHRIDPQ